MKNGETIAAIVFYLGVAALVVGAMLSARRAIERRGAGVDRRALALRGDRVGSRCVRDGAARRVAILVVR